MNDNTKICTCDTMNLEAITHLWNYRPRKFRSDAFLFWSRGPDSYRKNDRKRAVVWPWLVLQLSTVLALTQLGIRQSDWRRAGIRSTNLHIVVESVFTMVASYQFINVIYLPLFPRVASLALDETKGVRCIIYVKGVRLLVKCTQKGKIDHAM